MTDMIKKKSDVLAKQAFIHELEARGFRARVTCAPADITATRDGQTWYFEIKMTKRSDVYFGAATLTEWKQAMVDPDHFRFIVAKTDEAERFFEFIEFTPKEFMEFSTIPPFKIFFSINLKNHAIKRNHRQANKLTPENLLLMSECYEEIKKSSKNHHLLSVNR